MEDRAPYHTAPATPKGPRNLSQPLGEWLRAQGFSTSEQALPGYCLLTAHWLSARAERYEFTYTWQLGPAPSATCQLRVLGYGRLPETLFTAQHVRRVKDARQLVNNCVRLANARTLATLPHPAL